MLKDISGLGLGSNQPEYIVGPPSHPGSGSDRTIASERQSTALATLYIGGSVTCSQKKTQGA